MAKSGRSKPKHVVDESPPAPVWFDPTIQGPSSPFSACQEGVIPNSPGHDHVDLGEVREFLFRRGTRRP